MKLKLKLAGVVMAAAAVIVINPKARGNALLEIISGSETSGALSAPGTYTASSISVGGWTIAFAEGTTAPATGSLSAPFDDITSVNILKSGSKPLYIEFSASGFTSSTPAPMLATMSGVSLGGALSGTYSTYFTPTLFAGTVATPLPSAADLLTSESFTAGTLNGTATGVVTGGTPFALTQVIEITKGLASIDDTLQYTGKVPDGGATMILLGGSMAAMGLMRSRFTHAK